MIIKMCSDRFWVRGANIERWSEILKQLPRQIACKSKYEIAQQYLHYPTDADGRLVRADEVYGLFGAERSGEAIVLSGCNLIRQSGSGYELTEAAVQLVGSYCGDQKWERLLGQQLLQYSIRVRTLSIALLNGGFLVMPGGLKSRLNEAYLEYAGTKYHIFSEDPRLPNMNTLLNCFPQMSLGEFWRAELELENEIEIKYQGINSRVPSLGCMSYYFKMPLLLLEYLNWLKQDGEAKYIIDYQKLKEEVSAATLQSLLLQQSSNVLEILHELIQQYSDARGYFPVGIVGSLLKNKLCDAATLPETQWIDRFFMTGVKNGQFRIVDHEQGQPRHGRGLLDRNEYQLLKLEFE